MGVWRPIQHSDLQEGLHVRIGQTYRPTAWRGEEGVLRECWHSRTVDRTWRQGWRLESDDPTFPQGVEWHEFDVKVTACGRLLASQGTNTPDTVQIPLPKDCERGKHTSTKQATAATPTRGPSECSGVAIQTGGCCETATATAQTHQKYRASVLEYGDVVIASQNVRVHGCVHASSSKYDARHELLTIPAGEGGVVKNNYFERMMLKIDLPEVGVGFASYEDMELLISI